MFCCNKIEMSQVVQSRNVTFGTDRSKAFSPKTPKIVGVESLAP